MKRITLLFLILANALLAQKKKSYTIYVNYPDYTLKAEVLSEPLKKHARKNLDYYWYASNKIIKTQGGFEGKLLQGTYTSFYLSNNLKETGNFKNGVKHGEWTAWFDSGKISNISEWKNGLKHGESKTFNENGQLISAERYKKGLLNGTQITYTDENTASKKKFKRGKELIPKTKKINESQVTGSKKESRFKKLFKTRGKKKTEPSSNQNKTEKENSVPKKRFTDLLKKEKQNPKDSIVNKKKKEKKEKDGAK